jgi:hypothetical protein
MSRGGTAPSAPSAPFLPSFEAQLTPVAQRSSAAASSAGRVNAIPDYGVRSDEYADEPPSYHDTVKVDCPMCGIIIEVRAFVASFLRNKAFEPNVEYVIW